MKYIDELTNEDLQGKRVLLRLDLNVPVADGEILDTYRIDRVIDTVDYLRKHNAQTIIIAHCESGSSHTLVPMWHYMNGFFPVDFSTTFFTPEALQKILDMKDKGVLMFENLRMNPGEKENDPEFSKKLSQMADIYVNDAFGSSHRKHASVVGVPELLPHYGGLLMKDEINNLSKIFNPNKPLLFVLGGAKFETKLPLVKKYLDKADYIFIGGALANDLFKAKGYEVGISLLSDTDFDFKELVNNPKIIIPKDVTVLRPDDTKEFKSPDRVSKDEFIIDAGPETIKDLAKIMEGVKTVVWNGPVGKYKKGFKDMSEELAEVIAGATKEFGIESIVGGGDTIASFNSKDLNDKFSFVSTGGGAMVDFLVNETLPGIEALEN